MAATTYTVKRNDNLWNISKALLREATGKEPSNAEIQKEVNRLAAVNRLNNPDLIYVGQVLYLDTTGGTGEVAEEEDPVMVTIKHFGLQAGDTEGNPSNKLFVTWTFNRSHVDHYEVRWDYYTTNLIWFGGVSSTNTTQDKWDTYDIPTNAKQVRVRIRPISKKKTENGKEVNYFSGDWCEWKTYAVDTKPAAPGAPSLEINGLDLTATLSGIKEDIKIVKFEISKSDGSVVKNGKTSVETGTATYKCKVSAGFIYTARCQVIKDDVASDWSDYSAKQESAPAVPNGFTKCEAGEPTDKDEPTIRLEWSGIDTAVKYDIEYTTTKSYFDTTNQTTTISGIETTSWQIVSGVESGKEYFFRIRSVNSRGETSAWCSDDKIASCAIGKTPAPPTTWSSTTSAIVNEPLYLYWTHNSEDGSKLTYSHLFVSKWNPITEKYEEYLSWKLDHATGSWSDLVTGESGRIKADDSTTTGMYQIDTSAFVEGTMLQWYVRTAGISKNYSDDSVHRSIYIYAKPSLELNVTDDRNSAFEKLTSFPIKVHAVPYPASQAPVWYHLEIKSNDFYNTVDNIGNAKTVNAGEQVYSKHFDISTPLDTTISAGDVSLANNHSYTVTCTVSMNSGLVATASETFTVAWAAMGYLPNAEIGIDRDTLSAFISPYCTKYKSTIYKVNIIGGYYIKSVTSIDRVHGSPVNGILTTTNEQVYFGVTASGEEVHYCTSVEEVDFEGLTLSVYRREFDGTFTKLDPDVSSSSRTFITDPHPALDYARYRIVAKSDSTGQVRYYDLPGYPVNAKYVVIQWDEKWSSFDSYGSAESQEQPAWSGSMLKLPYNIDVSNKYAPDVSLVEYAGRKHPVSYYGTQLGETASWSVEIDSEDAETLYALRRLSVWMGDVYVREPSGSGYWANVKVNFSQKHKGLTIPVSLEVTRVEGGA